MYADTETQVDTDANAAQETNADWCDADWCGTCLSALHELHIPHGETVQSAASTHSLTTDTVSAVVADTAYASFM